MGRDEKLMLVLGAVALAAVIIWRSKPDNTPVPTDSVAQTGMSLTPDTANMTEGPAYLMSNRPYAFLPPINMYLPTVTAGQGNQTVVQPLDFVKKMGTLVMEKVNGTPAA